MPAITSILETCIYGGDLRALERFYAGVLGLRKVSDSYPRGLAFRVSPASVLLIFDPALTGQPHETVPSHGTQGPGHVAFAVPHSEWDAWRAHFMRHNISIEREVPWESGAHSLYVRDPAGNSVELMAGDHWQPAGLGRAVNEAWGARRGAAVALAATAAADEGKPKDQPADLSKAQLRVARPTDDLAAVVKFYRDGLGFEVLYEFKDHDGFDGVMLGRKGAAYHLEFTRKAGHKVGRAPTEDDLLVFYLPEESGWKAALARLENAGYKPVKAFNPYWDRKGRTFEDPDGYRVVLQNAGWDA